MAWAERTINPLAGNPCLEKKKRSSKGSTSKDFGTRRKWAVRAECVFVSMASCAG